MQVGLKKEGAMQTTEAPAPFAHYDREPLQHYKQPFIFQTVVSIIVYKNHRRVT